MDKKILKGISIFLLIAAAAAMASAQTSAPAPGTGSIRYGQPIGWLPGPSASAPAPGAGQIGFPTALPPYPSGYYGNPLVWCPSNVVYSPDWQNYGTANVVGCGYDINGVWRIVPMSVNYRYNGVQYDVEVINAWNPWTDTWDDDVDEPAINTSYYLNGKTFDFYTNLSTGTYYFNL